jgi:cytochrome c-type biogenesis protein CcmH/NrfF
MNLRVVFLRSMTWVPQVLRRLFCGAHLGKRNGGLCLPSLGKGGLAVALLLASALLLMGAASDDPGNKRFDRLGHAMMCQCGCGQVMLECNHVGCASSEQMRKELKAAMDRGDSDQVILAGFVSKYGPTVLSAPTNTGFNLVAWIMPVVIFLAGITAVTLVVRAWKRRAPVTSANTPAPASEELDEFRRRAREETSL